MIFEDINEYLKARGQHDVLDSPDLKGRRTDTSSDDIWQQEKVVKMIMIMVLMMMMALMMMMMMMMVMMMTIPCGRPKQPCQVCLLFQPMFVTARTANTQICHIPSTYKY